jgi:hypothetical protein
MEIQQQFSLIQFLQFMLLFRSSLSLQLVSEHLHSEHTMTFVISFFLLFSNYEDKDFHLLILYNYRNDS